MKIIKSLYTAALASLALVGCADLDTAPMGSTITSDQKAEVVEQNPEMVSASVAAITTMFSVYGTYDDNHNDFGYPATMLFLDSRGTDMVGMDVGYNWFSAGMYLTEGKFNTYMNAANWSVLYNQIYAANQVAKIIDPKTENSTSQFYLAQAYAIRAFDYFTLAQMYQFTYEGNTDAPCVPLILDTNADDAAANGIKRSTVGEVYEQIMKDINAAVALLEASSFTRADKRYVSYEVALGLRARIELVMQNYDAAQADAEAVIGSGAATPLSMVDAKKPGFKALTEPNWLWGIYIDETDRVVTTGICNWPSHMGSLCYGYCSVGAWRRINPTLYNAINSTDVRKGWFLDASAKSEALTPAQQAYLDDAGCPAYTQVKFAPYKDEIYTSTNANDIPLMRIEEMYLIKAECQAMKNDLSGAATTLINFVNEYRDPAFICAPTQTALLDAIWNQRRIELWGEGLSYFDIMRLRKGIDRPATAWASMDAAVKAYNYKIEDTKELEREAIEAVRAGNGGQTGKEINCLIYQIPDDEIEANPLLENEDNNLDAPTLVPVN